MSFLDIYILYNVHATYIASWGAGGTTEADKVQEHKKIVRLVSTAQSLWCSIESLKISFANLTLFYLCISSQVFIPCRTGVQQAECATCKPKRPNPDKKIYTERTIEIGLVTDVYLWDKMKVRNC